MQLGAQTSGVVKDSSKPSLKTSRKADKTAKDVTCDVSPVMDLCMLIKCSLVQASYRYRCASRFIPSLSVYLGGSC